jgi:hypothetical protein
VGSYASKLCQAAAGTKVVLCCVVDHRTQALAWRGLAELWPGVRSILISAAKPLLVSLLFGGHNGFHKHDPNQFVPQKSHRTRSNYMIKGTLSEMNCLLVLLLLV